MEKRNLMENRVVTYLTKEQRERLAKMKERTGVPIAEWLRRAVKKQLEAERPEDLRTKEKGRR